MTKCVYVICLDPSLSYIASMGQKEYYRGNYTSVLYFLHSHFTALSLTLTVFFMVFCVLQGFL